MLRRQRQPYLAEQLVLQAAVELRGGHRLQRAEMHVAGGRDHCVDRAGLREQGRDAFIVGQIHAQRAAAAAGGKNLVMLAKVAGDRLAKGAAGTDKQDLHRGVLMGKNCSLRCRMQVL